MTRWAMRAVNDGHDLRANLSRPDWTTLGESSPQPGLLAGSPWDEFRYRHLDPVIGEEAPPDGVPLENLRCTASMSATTPLFLSCSFISSALRDCFLAFNQLHSPIDDPLSCHPRFGRLYTHILDHTP